ncbi:hypothetical protein KIPB_011467, partial [Kipferlia bialata]|eukprot:g11467.t1
MLSLLEGIRAMHLYLLCLAVLCVHVCAIEWSANITNCVPLND